ncbi:MAG: M67 family metallopeptidase [Bacteroidaceae bacterium]|nr:M67 family metallopeptidase [Bacteroidaceae bacterium]
MEITEEVKEAIIRQAQADAPIESCGYLLGKDNVVSENYPMTNVDHSEEHFSFEPREQFAALKYARNHGLRILANWHSHPASPSRPSEEDKRLANDPTIRYAILSLLDGKITLNSFKIVGGEVIDKEIHIE